MLGRWLVRLTSGLLIASVASMFPVFCVRAQTFWVFNHGVSDSPEAFNYLTSSLGLGTSRASSKHRNIDILGDSTSKTLMDQAARVSLDLSLNLYAPKAKNLIFVGQSQGGLRTRRFLQQEIYKPSSKVRPSQVKGLALIGTPNYGAAAAANYPDFLNQVRTIVNVTLTFSVIGSVFIKDVNNLKDTLEKNIARGFGGPSLTQMKPGSDFLDELNNISRCTTKTSTSNRTTLWTTKEVATSSTSCSSGGYPTFKPIPKDTYVMSIVGQQSSLEKLPSPLGGDLKPLTLATASAILTGVFFAASFIPFIGAASLPIAVALAGLTVLLLALQLMWNGMIGSNRHDILISEESQELRDARGIGGKFLQTRKLQQALHADITSGRFSTSRDDRFELRSIDTRNALADLKATVER